MSLTEVQDTIDWLLENALDAEDSMRLAISYRYIDDYYSNNAGLPVGEDKKVVLNSLETYPYHELIIDTEKVTTDRTRQLLTRSFYQHASDWAYRYGSLGRPDDEIEVPQVPDRPDDPTNRVIHELNDKIQTNPDLTVNDAGLALTLSAQIADRYGFEELDERIFESEAREAVFELINIANNFIESHRENDTLNWDRMASTFDELNTDTHTDIMENYGRRSVLRSLQDFESDSIEEFLEQSEDAEELL